MFGKKKSDRMEEQQRGIGVECNLDIDGFDNSVIFR